MTTTLSPKLTSTFATALFLTILSSLNGAEPKGFLIYSEPPSTYMEACEYTNVVTGPSYITVFRVDGKKVELRGNALLTAVEYPVVGTQTEILTIADSNIQRIKELSIRFPQFKGQLEMTRAKWENAASFAKQMAANAAKEDAKIPKINLTVDGTNYEGVRLSAVNGESIEISHSVGSAKIPIGRLRSDQIVALNSTSTIVHIDPALALKQKQLLEEKVRLETAQAEQKKQEVIPPVKATPVEVNNTEATANLDSTDIAAPALAEAKKLGPPTETVLQGGKRLGAPPVAFKRGAILESRGIAGVPIGTPIFPVRFKDWDVVYYYMKDEFGDWRVFLEQMQTTIPCDPVGQ